MLFLYVFPAIIFRICLFECNNKRQSIGTDSQEFLISSTSSWGRSLHQLETFNSRWTDLRSVRYSLSTIYAFLFLFFDTLFISSPNTLLCTMSRDGTFLIENEISSLSFDCHSNVSFASRTAHYNNTFMYLV